MKLLFELGEENDFVHQSHEYNTRWDRWVVVIRTGEALTLSSKIGFIFF